MDNQTTKNILTIDEINNETRQHIGQKSALINKILTSSLVTLLPL